ncbi:MAG: SDR family oxidoreductase [Candidatus Aminicenantes bacterium]|nr:SDR family oxidoreductase [Candidatus Aminicenantes bacterium]MCK5004904.1 SDR family oxidoreductase [Candidatus Aminicenantes bacterium]
MRTVLITGGAGFLGSHLTDKFLIEGWNVIVLDNLITGSIDNISHLIGKENFKFIKYDVTDYLFFEEDIDLILHFACPASPVDYFQHPIHTMKVDSLGTLNTLGLARNKNARYVFASTSEIYGSPQVHPQTEDYWGNVNPVGVRSVYDEAKRFSEAMCMAYYREHGIDIRISRIFNTYGTRMKLTDGRVIPTFISQALSGKDITIFGNGSHTRSFCYVDDLTKGIYDLSDKNGLKGSVLNLGNPDEFTIKSLAEIIISLTGSGSKIVYKDIPEDDPPIRKPDISKAKELLGFSSVTTLEEGLKKIIPWFQKRLDG